MTERVPSPHTTSPSPRDDENLDKWTDRLVREGSALGVFRQCSIGWHGECSARHDGVDAECQCECHGQEEKSPLWSSGEVSLHDHEDTLELEDDEFSLLTLTKDEALGLAAVLTQWARS